jgi:hypothetical protein
VIEVAQSNAMPAMIDNWVERQANDSKPNFGAEPFHEYAKG